MRSPTSLPRTLLVIGLLACGALAAVAQEAEPGDAGASAPEVSAIPLQQVAESAEATGARLKKLLDDEDSEAELKQIQEDLESATAVISTRLDTVQQALEGSPTVQGLRDLETELAGLEKPLLGIERSLRVAGGHVTTAIEQVDRDADLWKRTDEAARGASASGEVVRRITATRRKLAESRKQLIARRNRVLALSDRVVDKQARIARVANEVGTALEKRIEGVLSVDRPPLWTAAARDALRDEFSEGWKDPIVARLQLVYDYIRERAALLVAQLMLFVGLALGLRALGRRAQDRAVDDFDLSSAAVLFGMPVSMAAVLTLILTPELHPVAPRLFILLTGTIAVVPAILIVHRLSPQAMFPLVVGLLFFFLVDRARAILESLPSVERFIFVFELIAALAFLLWLVRPSRLAELPPEARSRPFLRSVGVGIRALLALLGVALAADVLGLGDLAELVGNGALRSAYFALFAYALLKALQSIVAYLLVLRPLRLLRLVSRHRLLLRQRLDRGLVAVASSIWAYASLSTFTLTEPLTEIAQTVLSAHLSAGALSISLGDVLLFGLTLWLSFSLARFINFVLEEDVFPRVRLARGVPYAVSSMVRYTLFFFGFLFALAAAGIKLGNLTVVAGGLGVGIGFGLQTVVNNFVSGLILLFERPIEVGDVVQLPGLWGEIRRIGIRASTVRTFDGAEVIVPNGNLLAESVTNWTLSDRNRRLEIDVGVDYGTDAQRVIDLLEEVARSHNRVLEHPPHRAFFMNFGDSALEFRLRAWISNFDDSTLVRSELAVAIQTALRDADIGVPFPQRDLHLKSVAPEVSAKLLSGGGVDADSVS